MKKNQDYALYKGDEFIDLGTIEELAQKMGCKPTTMYYYASPSQKRRDKNYKCLVAYRIEDEDE